MLRNKNFCIPLFFVYLHLCDQSLVILIPTFVNDNIRAQVTQNRNCNTNWQSDEIVGREFMRCEIIHGESRNRALLSFVLLYDNTPYTI